jgi:hypothetical protein
MYEYTYDGHKWLIGQFENGSWGFQQDNCPIRYTSKYEAELIAGLMANSINS